MKYRKFNKYERKENQKQQVEKAMSGAGMYLFANNHNADLTLPRPTSSGRRQIGPKEQFQGDDYYMQMVKTGDLRLIKTLQTAEQQMLQENTVEKEEKLILDQPDMITEQGKVEHVAAEPVVKPMNESGSDENPPEVLLNEDPEGFIICDD